VCTKIDGVELVGERPKCDHGVPWITRSSLAWWGVLGLGCSVGGDVVLSSPMLYHETPSRWISCELFGMVSSVNAAAFEDNWSRMWIGRIAIGRRGESNGIVRRP
jgi:hypothetical protein